MDAEDEVVDHLHNSINTIIGVFNLAKLDYDKSIIVISCLIGSAGLRFEDHASLDEILEDIKVSSVDAFHSIKEDNNNG